MDYSLYLVTDRRFMGKQTLAEAVEQAILVSLMNGTIWHFMNMPITLNCFRMR